MDDNRPDGLNDTNSEYFAAVGFLCHQWNHVEHFQYQVASDIMNLDTKFHALLFRHLGIKSLQDFILDYATAHLDTAIVAQVKHVNLYVDRCRANRNLIIHGNFRNDDENADATMLLTRPDRNRKKPSKFRIDINDIYRVALECEVAGMSLIRLTMLFQPDDAQDELIVNSGMWEQWKQVRYNKPALPKFLNESLERHGD